MSSGVVGRDAELAALRGFLASVHQDGSLRIVKLPGGDEVRVIREQGSALTAVAFHPAGRTLAAGGLDGAVRFYRVGNGRRTVTLTAPGPAGSLLFDADGSTLFVGTTDAMGRGCVRVWTAGERERP